MILLLLSILALFLGPAIYLLTVRSESVRLFVKSFVFISMVGFIISAISPFLINEFYFVTIIAVCTGLFISLVFHKLIKKKIDFRMIIFLPSIVGLIFHSLLDGIALYSSEIKSIEFLALAVVLHRLIMGLVIWWFVRPRLGTQNAVFITILIVIGTIAGYYFGMKFSSLISNQFSAAFQGFMAGTLSHIIFSHETFPEYIEEIKSTGSNIAFFLGGLCATFLVIILLVLHH